MTIVERLSTPGGRPHLVKARDQADAPRALCGARIHRHNGEFGPGAGPACLACVVRADKSRATIYTPNPGRTEWVWTWNPDLPRYSHIG